MKKLISLGMVMIMFVLLFSKYGSVNKVEGYTQIKNNRVLCCDQYNNDVFVCDLSDGNKRIFSYHIPAAQPKYSREQSPTEAKLRYHADSKKTLLLITTGTTLYVVDYSTKVLLRHIKYNAKDFGSKAINAHSVEMSPKGYIYVTDPNNGIVVRYKMDKDFKEIKYNTKMSLYNAHTVLYDFENQCIWCAGDNKVVKWMPNGDKTTRTINYKVKKGDDFRWAHCLIQNPKNSNELLLAGGSGVVSISKKEFVPSNDVLKCSRKNLCANNDDEDGIKGMVCFNDKIYYARHADKEGTEKSWQTKRIRANGKAVVEFGNNIQIYKILPLSKDY